MQLIFYEWKKLWKNASVLKMFLFFLLISMAVFWGELSKDQEWIPLYQQMHRQMDSMDLPSAQQWFDAQKEQSFDDDWAAYHAQTHIEQELKALQEYDEYRESIQKRYELSSSISIFADGTNQDHMKKIAQRYAKLTIDAPMQIGMYKGLQVFLDFYAGDIFAIVFLLYLVSIVFIQEERSGKSDFARTMLNGNRKLFYTKVLTITAGVSTFLVLMSVLHFMIIRFVYGAFPLSAAIQSVPDFYAVPYAWTIGEYLLVTLLIKLFGIVLLSAMIILVTKMFLTEIPVYITAVALLGIHVWLWTAIKGDGLLSVFRQWNVWGMIRGETFVKNYALIRIGSVSFSSVWGVPILAALILLILWLASRIQWKLKQRKQRVQTRKLSMPRGLFFYEWKKLWRYQGALLLFVGCLAAQGITIAKYENRITQDEYYYNQYVDQIGNRIEKDTDAKIQKEEIRLRKLEDQLMMSSEDELGESAIGIQMELDKQGGFFLYQDRVKALQEMNKTPEIIKDSQYRLLFSSTEVSRTFVILLCASFAFLIPAFFQKEKESNMIFLQQTSVYGGKKLWFAKIGNLLLYYLTFVLCNAVMVWIRVNDKYELDWNAPIQNLQVYWTKDWSCSIQTAWIIGIMAQCVVATILVLVLSMIARRIQNKYVMIGILLAVMVVPTILSVSSPLRILRLVHDALFVFTI